MTNYVNYFLTSKNSRLINGHIKSEELYNKILNHDGSEAYCCYFDLDEKLLKLEYDTRKLDKEGKKIYEYYLNGTASKNAVTNYKCNGKSFAKYEGICRPALDMVSFDFDSDDINKSLKDVRDFIEWLDIDNLLVFFSGSKGFHVMVPFGYFPFEPNEHLPNQLKDLAKYLQEFYKTLDTSIYNYNRKFRVPFSKHDKSGLYKNLVYPESSLTEMKESCENRDSFDFLGCSDINFHVKPLGVINQAVELSKRKSYEIEKHRAGTIEKPSNFEKFDGKLCIKKMLESTCEAEGRNNSALRIVNDYYRTGKPRSVCEKDLMAWASNNGLPAGELNEIITNIYERGANYNFGCQDEIKSSFCSGKCPIWIKLDPEKRPEVVDSPVQANSSSMKNEFHGVKFLMEKIFACKYDEESQTFSDGFIVKQDAKNLFYYKDKHWQHIDEAKVHILKTRLNAEYNNKLSIRKLDSVFKMLVMYVPAKPDDIDLFAPKNDSANFLDGTLHLVRKNNKFDLEFREHSKLDFCTTIIEQNYGDYLKNRSIVNEGFESWLKEFLDNDEEAYHLVQEMFGSSIMPKFAQVFILLGKSGTGKSTTIKILKKLHKNENNISGVGPDKFHGFNMTSMIGKLMNIVNDIKTNCKIDDDIVKQIDDQEPIRIEVKGRDDVYTRLPALHIFGANKMPSTDEGYSGAMDRRVSIVNYDKQFTGEKNTEIASDLFNDNPLGILAFALRGLERLICGNNGEYSKSSRSKKNVKDWTKDDDIFWSFIEDAEVEPVTIDGTVVKLIIDKDLKVKSSTVWSAFKAWQEIAIEQRNQIGRNKFFKMVKNHGFSKKISRGVFYFFGLGIQEGSDDTV